MTHDKIFFIEIKAQKLLKRNCYKHWNQITWYLMKVLNRFKQCNFNVLLEPIKEYLLYVKLFHFYYVSNFNWMWLNKIILLYTKSSLSSYEINLNLFFIFYWFNVFQFLSILANYIIKYVDITSYSQTWHTIRTGSFTCCGVKDSSLITTVCD